MTCAHVLGLIDAGPFAVCRRADLDAAREHARHCPTCGPAMTMMRELEIDLGALPDAMPAPDFTAAVLARIAGIPAGGPAPIATKTVAPAWHRWPAWAGALGGAIAVAAIQWTASGYGTPLAPRTGTLTTSLIAMPAVQPELVLLVIGLLLYAKGLFSVTASASPARRGAAGDRGSAPR